VILNRIKQVFDGEHPESDKLLISVSDNGKGIKKKHKKQLFKLYGSIKSETENSKGIGLGLVISKMIVEKFDGVINFVSKF
jgi:K+-sensing histidine kinase KdpD